MAGPWGRSGGSSGPWGGATSNSQSLPTPKKKKKRSGLGGFFGNLAGDVGALAGIPAGLVSIGRSQAGHHKGLIEDYISGDYDKAARRLRRDPLGPGVTGMAQGMLQPGGTVHTWKPLFVHRDFDGLRETAHNIYDHPLAPVLDVATVATAGAGATARVARLAAPASKIARSSQPTTIMMRAPRTPKGKLKGEDVELQVGVGSYVNPLRKGRTLATHAAVKKLGLEPRRWERHNRIRIRRQMATIENAWLGYLEAGKAFSEPGPLRNAAQARTVQHMHRELKRAAHEVDELPAPHVYIRNEGGPEMFRAKEGHSFVQTKGGNWREVKDTARLPTEKVLHTTGEGAFLMRGNTARLVRVPPALKAKDVPEGPGTGGGTRLTRYKDGTVKETGGAFHGAGEIGKSLKAPKGKAWAKVGDAKWKLVDAKPKGKDVLRAERGHVLERKGNVIVQRRGNASLGKAMGPEEFENALRSGIIRDMFTTKNAAEAVKGANGKPLAVPKRLVDDFIDEGVGSHHTLTNMFARPDSIWRAFVLAVPRYGVNNMVGTSAIFMLNNPAAARHYVEAVRIVGGHRRAKKVLDAKPGAGVEWMDELFGHMYGHGFVEQVPKFKTGGKLAKVGNLERRWYDFVNRWSEENYRVAAVLHRVRKDPEIREMRARGLSEKEAVLAKARADGQWVNRVSDDIDDIFGQYRYLNKIETGVRTVVPFYGWSRAITRSTFNTFKDRPGRFYMATLVGKEGIEDTERKLGELPRFLKGVIPIGDKGGRERVLMTSGLNPWATPADLMQGTASAMGGGGRAGETLGGQLGPLGSTVAETFTGERLLTGDPHKKGFFGVAAENFGVAPDKPGLPQWRVTEATLKSIRGEDEPGTWTDRRGRTGDRLFDPSAANEWASIMGVPLRDLSRKAARKRKREEDAY